nr:ulp1 protease family, C-terminal catalytic domain-containing protein [Tanacetum cinerariifolium]
MFDGTYATDEERWENFSAQGSVQFKESVNGLALSGIDLAIEIKFATKILLHEINVHASKMLELAKEFDKLDPREKLSIVVEAEKAVYSSSEVVWTPKTFKYSKIEGKNP